MSIVMTMSPFPSSPTLSPSNMSPGFGHSLKNVLSPSSSSSSFQFSLAPSSANHLFVQQRLSPPIFIKSSLTELEMSQLQKSAATLTSSSSASASAAAAAAAAAEFSIGMDSDDYWQPVAMTWLLTTAYIVIFITALVANAVTISYYILHRNAGMVTNAFVVSLCIADMAWPLVGVPYGIAQLWTPHWVFGSVACRIIPLLQLVLPEVMTLSLCAIAIERYFTVLHPFDTNPLLKPKVAVAFVGAIWIIPFAVNSWLPAAYTTVQRASKQLATPSTSSPSFPSTLCLPSVDTTSVWSALAVESLFINVVIPAVVFPVCYGQIILSVFKSDSSTANVVDFNRRLAFEHRKRVVTFVSVLVQAGHFVCWFPLATLQVVFAFRTSQTRLDAIDVTCLKVFTLLATANAAFNSLVYTAIVRNDPSAGASRAGYRTASNASTFALIGILVQRTRAMAVTMVSYNGGPDNPVSHPQSQSLPRRMSMSRARLSSFIGGVRPRTHTFSSSTSPSASSPLGSHKQQHLYTQQSMMSSSSETNTATVGFRDTDGNPNVRLYQPSASVQRSSASPIRKKKTMLLASSPVTATQPKK